MKKSNLLCYFTVILLLLCSNYLSAMTLGDVDDNGTINIVDALKVAQYTVGLSVSPFNTAAAEVSGDANITIVDALVIAQYYVGLITTFPAAARTSTPAITASPTIAPIADNYFYRQVAQLNDNIVVVDDDFGSGSGFYYCPAFTNSIKTDVAGYTGEGYIHFSSYPATVYFFISIARSGTFNIGVRSYNATSGNWEITNNITPVSVDLTNGYYRFNFSIPYQNYMLDRIVIYPAGTAASVWQDLSHPASVTFTSGNLTTHSFTLQ